MMAKIVHIVESFGGGVFSSVTQLLNLSAAGGNNCYLIFSERDETPKNIGDLVDERVNLRNIPIQSNISVWQDLRSLLLIRNALKRIEPDIIHLHSSKAGFLGRVAAWSLRLQNRVIYNPRGFSFLRTDISNLKSYFFAMLEKLALGFGGQLVVCSKGEQESAVKFLKIAPPQIIENGVEVEPLLSKRVHVDNRCDRRTVVCAGRLSPQKMPHVFAELAQKFSQENIGFIWVGSGENSWSKELECSGIKVTGWLSRDEGLDYIASADVYVQYSAWEGMPLAVIEAQILGIPSVVSDCVGCRDIVQDCQTGFVVNSVETLFEKTKLLLDNEAIRNEMGEQASHTAEIRFSISRVYEEYLGLYHSVLAKEVS